MIATGGVIAAGTGVTLMARVLGGAGVPVTRASLLSVAWTLTNLSTGAFVAAGTFAVPSSVFDSPVQGDPRWQLDTPARPGVDGLSGYNFLATLPAAQFPVTPPALGVTPPAMQCDVLFTPASGEPFRQTFQWASGTVYG